MLVEAQLTTRPQHAPDLPERLGDLEGTAQDEGADNNITGGVAHRQPRQITIEEPDRSGHLGGDPLGSRPQEGIRLDKQNLVDAGRIAAELDPVARADLQHTPAEVRHEPLTLPSRARVTSVSIANPPWMVELFHPHPYDSLTIHCNEGIFRIHRPPPETDIPTIRSAVERGSDTYAILTEKEHIHTSS